MTAQINYGQFDKDFNLNKMKPPDYITRERPTETIKIKDNKFNLSDQVIYGYTNTIFYQRGIRLNADTPDDDIEGFIVDMIPQKAAPSIGNQPPALPRGSFGKKLI